MIQREYDGGFTILIKNLFGWAFYFRRRGKDNPRKPRYIFDCARTVNTEYKGE